jgi:hypothetical protein
MELVTFRILSTVFLNLCTERKNKKKEGRKKVWRGHKKRERDS